MFWTKEQKARYLTKRVRERLDRYLKHISCPKLIESEMSEEIKAGLEFIEKAEKGSGESGL